VRQQVAAQSRGLDVLDVGCYTGQLLSSLPNHHRLHGIEPNKAAAARAATRGIKVIADRFEALADRDQNFDVITACDVIEHVMDPLAFLRQLRARLNPGGLLMLTTGNCDAWLWRMFGSRFWYCYFPDHISFIGNRWLEVMPARAGLKLLQSVPFNYGARGFSGAALRSLLGAGLYACSPQLLRWVRRSVGGARLDGSPPPGSGASRDHIFCVMSAV
jgi:SAM-dependent methyltransferase